MAVWARMGREVALGVGVPALRDVAVAEGRAASGDAEVSVLDGKEVSDGVEEQLVTANRRKSNAAVLLIDLFMSHLCWKFHQARVA